MAVFPLKECGYFGLLRSLNPVPYFCHDLHAISCVPSRFAGRYRDSRKESFTSTDLNSEMECDSSSRRQSFMKMVGLGKLKKESMADRSSFSTEEQEVQQKEEEVKPREPLSGTDDPVQDKRWF